MKFLILVSAIVPIVYATGDVFGDLLGEEFQEYSAIDHVRDKRQTLNQGAGKPLPPHIQQLLQLQAYRPPLVPIPSQPVPKLGPPPGPVKQVSQSQVSQYKPQVTFASGNQQPDYRDVAAKAAQYKKPILPQQPQYRPQPVAQPNYNAAPQPNYNPAPQQYSNKVPPHIQQLLAYQKNIASG